MIREVNRTNIKDDLMKIYCSNPVIPYVLYLSIILE